MWKSALLQVFRSPHTLNKAVYKIQDVLFTPKAMCNKYHTSKCVLTSLQSFEKTVDTFCNITLKSSINVDIRPTDPTEFKNNDKVLLYFDSPSDEVNVDVAQIDLTKLDIIIHSKVEPLPSNVSCTLKVPVQSSIEIFSSGKGQVQIKDIQSEKISVSSDNGAIETRNIRCSKIELHSKGGNIYSRGVLQGNIKLSTSKTGIIECQRLQGRSVEINTVAGDIRIASSYCDHSSFKSESGNVRLENLHRNCDVVMKTGNLVVSGLDGSLDAVLDSGDADIQVSNLWRDSSLKTHRGNLKIRLTDSSNCQLHLKAKKLLIPESFKNNCSDINITSVTTIICGNAKNAPVMKAISDSGVIELLRASWISTLNLGKKK